MPVTFRFNSRDAMKDLNKVRRGFKGKVLQAAATGIGKQGVKELSKAAPKGPGSESHLKDSFSFAVSTKGVVRFLSSKLYAVMTSKGTKPSTGGYVPFLGARLTKRVARSRKLVSQKLKQHPGSKATKYINKAAAQLNMKAVAAVMAELRRQGYIRRGKFVVPDS